MPVHARMRAAVTFARESEIAMSSNGAGTFYRAATRAGQVLNRVAFVILLIFIGIAIIN